MWPRRCERALVARWRGGATGFAVALAVVLGSVPAGCAPPQPTMSAKVIRTISGPDGDWDYAAFDAARGRVLVGRSYGVMAVDIASGAVRKLSDGQHVHSALPLPNGRVLVTNGDADTVALVDGSTGATISTTPVGKDPDAAVFDAETQRAYVMDGESGEVSVIDIASGAEVRRIAVGGKLEGATLDTTGRLYVNLADRAQVVGVDPASGAIRSRYALPDCVHPTAIAYVAAAGALVSACANGRIEMISAENGRLISTAAIGPHPDGAVFDPARDKLFVSTAGSLTSGGEVAVLKIAPSGQLVVSERIPTRRGARTLAEDPSSGRLYLPDATYEIGWNLKPRVRPGTFGLLELAP